MAHYLDGNPEATKAWQKANNHPSAPDATPSHESLMIGATDDSVAEFLVALEAAEAEPPAKRGWLQRLLGRRNAAPERVQDR